MESDVPPFSLKTIKTSVPRAKKGKQREMQDEDFEKERAWLLLKVLHVAPEDPDVDESLQDRAPGGAGPSMTDLNLPPEEEGGLECGCCFSPSHFVCFLTAL
jgi:hypothetical protein